MAFTKALTGSGFAPAQAQNAIGFLDPAITATGTTGPTAYPMGLGNSKFTTVGASSGGILPLGATPGDTALVSNDGANALTIYPPTGGTINGSASISIAAAGWAIISCWSADGLTWKSK